MKTVELIKQSNSNQKTQDYLKLANELTVKAYQLADGNPFLGRFINEMEILCHKSVDCEYAAYTNAHAVEVWFTKINGLKSGKLKLSDLF
jgi:hypothetical protein